MRKAETSESICTCLPSREAEESPNALDSCPKDEAESFTAPSQCEGTTTASTGPNSHHTSSCEEIVASSPLVEGVVLNRNMENITPNNSIESSVLAAHETSVSMEEINPVARVTNEANSGTHFSELGIREEGFAGDISRPLREGQFAKDNGDQVQFVTLKYDSTQVTRGLEYIENNVSPPLQVSLIARSIEDVGTEKIKPDTAAIDGINASAKSAKSLAETILPTPLQTDSTHNTTGCNSDQSISVNGSNSFVGESNQVHSNVNHYQSSYADAVQLQDFSQLPSHFVNVHVADEQSDLAVHAIPVENEIYDATLVQLLQGQNLANMHFLQRKQQICIAVAILVIGALGGIVGTVLTNRESSKNIGGDSDVNITAANDESASHPSDPSSPSACLLATTIPGIGYQEGPINIYVDSGSGYSLASEPGKYYRTKEVVVDQCYNHIDGVQIGSNNDDGWLGMVELSTDGKKTYNPLICSDCTGTVSVMPIAVDGNFDFTGPFAQCLGGAICTLLPSPLAWKPVDHAIEGDASSDFFGSSLSLSGDGRILVVGAHLSNGNGQESGSVKIFKWDESSSHYDQVGQTILGDEPFDHFGCSVAISQDGFMIAVGARQNSYYGNHSGQLKLFSMSSDESSYKLHQVFYGAGSDEFGSFVTLSADGKTLAASAQMGRNGSGYVKLFRLDEDSLDYVIVPDLIVGNINDFLGHSVALAGDGMTVAVGSPFANNNGVQSGYVKIFRFDNQGSWNQIGADIIGTDHELLGWSVALSHDGNTVAVSAPTANSKIGNNTGAVTVFVLSDSEDRWEAVGEEIIGFSEYIHFGESVGLSSDGNTLALGSKFSPLVGENSGAAAVYQWDDSLSYWTNVGNYITGDEEGDELGNYISLSSDGETIAVSGWKSDSNGVDSGHVKIYKLEKYGRIDYGL